MPSAKGKSVQVQPRGSPCFGVVPVPVLCSVGYALSGVGLPRRYGSASDGGSVNACLRAGMSGGGRVSGLSSLLPGRRVPEGQRLGALSRSAT